MLWSHIMTVEWMNRLFVQDHKKGDSAPRLWDLVQTFIISPFCFSRFPQTRTYCWHLKSEDINSPNGCVGGKAFRKFIFFMSNSIKLAHILFGHRGTSPDSVASIILWLEQIKGQKGWIFYSYTTSQLFFFSGVPFRRKLCWILPVLRHTLIPANSSDFLLGSALPNQRLDWLFSRTILKA